MNARPIKNKRIDAIFNVDGDEVDFDSILTTVTINTWSLFKRSGKKKAILEIDPNNRDDLFMFRVLSNIKTFEDVNLYVKMPFFKYFKFKKENQTMYQGFKYSFFGFRKHKIDKKKILEDAKNAYNIDDKYAFDKIYTAYFEIPKIIEERKEKDEV